MMHPFITVCTTKLTAVITSSVREANLGDKYPRAQGDPTDKIITSRIHFSSPTLRPSHPMSGFKKRCGYTICSVDACFDPVV